MALVMERLLPTGHLRLIVRSVSSKYPRPHPRSHQRRLFEAAVKPILPDELPTCGTWKETVKQREAERVEYMPIELALVDKIQKWIKNENFRVMAVCQLLSVSEQKVYLAKNQLRLKDLYYAGYHTRMIEKMFEGTPFQSLKPLFHGAENTFIFGRDFDSIKVIIDETAKIPFLIPLAITADSRILSMDEAKALAKYDNIEHILAETVQILQRTSVDLTQSLNHHSQDLVSTLSRIQ